MKKYVANTSKKHGCLFLKARIFINTFEEGHQFYKKAYKSPIMGNYKIEGLKHMLIGRIDFQSQRFDDSKNGEVVGVSLLANNQHKSMIEKRPEIIVSTGIEDFATLKNIEIIGFDVAFENVK